MVKRLFILFILLFGIKCFATDYYVSPSGDDATNDGSYATPWRTVSWACSQVSPGDNIYLLSDITDSGTGSLPLDVNLSSYGGNKFRIRPSTNGIYLNLYSGSLQNGQQTISNIIFDGNSYDGYVAIKITNRNNVEISNCEFRQFYNMGVHYAHQTSWLYEPADYMTGGSVHNCVFYDNASRGVASDEGNLRIDGQKDFNIYNNQFSQPHRASANVGKCLDWSWVKNVHVYSNTFTGTDHNTYYGAWNFLAELWNTRGGCEIYDNIMYGGVWDMGGFYNEKCEYAFCYKFYRNKMYKLSIPFYRDETARCGLTIETGIQAQYRNTYSRQEYIWCYQNYFEGYPVPIEVATGQGIQDCYVDHIYIYSNIVSQFNYADYQYNYGILLIGEQNGNYASVWSNIYIWNNNIYGGSYYNYVGIYFNTNGSISNIYIQNNIVHSCDYYAVYFTKQTEDPNPCTVTNAQVTYNDFYANGNNSVYQGGSITYSGCNFSTGNRTDDPVWLNTPGDMRLDPTSPLIAQGVPALITLTDYLGGSFNVTNPSMGAYEYGAPPEPPIEVEYPTGLIKYGGRFVKYNGRLVKIAP